MNLPVGLLVVAVASSCCRVFAVQVEDNWEDVCDYNAVLYTENPHLPPDGSATWTSYCIGACVNQLDTYCRNAGYRTDACCTAHWETVACFTNVCIDATATIATNPTNPDLAACDMATVVAQDFGTMSQKLRYCQYGASSPNPSVSEVYTTAGVMGLLLEEKEAFVGFSCQKDAIDDMNPRPSLDACGSDCAIFAAFVPPGATTPPTFCTSCEFLDTNNNSNSGSGGSIAYDCRNLFPDKACAYTNAQGECQDGTTATTSTGSTDTPTNQDGTTAITSTDSTDTPTNQDGAATSSSAGRSMNILGQAFHRLFIPCLP
eukprot:scaffold575_cov186-Amphora_coffeaeformis.AAC.13